VRPSMWSGGESYAQAWGKSTGEQNPTHHRGTAAQRNHRLN
jgi:hypothetical protein